MFFNESRNDSVSNNVQSRFEARAESVFTKAEPTVAIQYLKRGGAAEKKFVM